ncbi:unnamed protein product [Calicophoron daubneyi]|uniref:Uncharacterized protein n=1 Tax=Calicophoron daubneyi TaxID=300641 RepID=A0AAV2TZK2_CALDB
MSHIMTDLHCRVAEENVTRCFQKKQSESAADGLRAKTGLRVSNFHPNINRFGGFTDCNALQKTSKSCFKNASLSVSAKPRVSDSLKFNLDCPPEKLVRPSEKDDYSDIFTYTGRLDSLLDGVVDINRECGRQHTETYSDGEGLAYTNR